VSRPRPGRWTVPGLTVGPAAALELLDSLTTRAADQAEVAPSVRFAAAVAAFARDLVRRGRVLPGLVAEGDAHAARWRPVLTGADVARFRDLAAAMPPACRAAGEERPSAPKLRAALGGLGDAGLRLAHPDPLVDPRAARRSVEERWLRALTAGDARLPGADAKRAGDLARALDDWFTAVHRGEGPVRTCFRLIEPMPEPGGAGEPERWRVEFALQSADDPSLYVPAETIWAGLPLPGLSGDPEEELLAGLGRAVRLFPALKTTLRSRRPAQVTLDTAGAFDFLRQAAPLLQAAGFGVRLPAWAGRSRLGLKLTTTSRAQSQAAVRQGFGLSEIVDFRVDLAVGDEIIGEEELTELARLKIPLVRVRGQWVELDERGLDAALRAVSARRTGEMTAAEVIQQVVAGGDDDLPLVAVDADGPLGDLLSGEADRRLVPIATPASFNGTLRPYQERGLAWLNFLNGLGLGAVLADDMGLGKTAQTISLLLEERRSCEAVRPTLLVCPMSLVGNWQREVERFGPSLDLSVHHGPARRRDAELAETVAKADLVVTTYGTAARDREALAALDWGRVVCDEAQAIKNSGTRQAQAVRSIPAASRLALTGTPVENHLAELWSIMEFCNPGLLGPRATFRTRYQEPIEARADEQAATALKRATGPFVLRRLKTDKSIIDDLPEKFEMKVWCTLTQEQASLDQAVVDDMLARIDDSEGMERRGNVLAAMARLKQVCNHPAQLLKDGTRLPGRSGKLARLEELTSEIAGDGEKALLFTQYAEFGALLQPYLAARLERPVLWLHGGLTTTARDRLVDRFQHDDEPMMFLLSLKAAGTGLNLTAANHVVHIDRWWNPAVEDQATDRAFRIGQRKDVQVRKFVCVGTLEERIDQMIERKKALAERIVGTGEDWLTDLSTDELREVFRLSPEAVS
jgi:SNF2 family DNA or RNA helicase